MQIFYEVFVECKKFVLSNDFQRGIQKWMCRPPLNRFKSIGGILEFLNTRFNHACLGEVRRQNAILKKLFYIHQRKNKSVDLEPLFLVIFKQALQGLSKKYRWADPEGDDLGQVIFESFLEVLRNYPLKVKPKRIAPRIVLYTKRRVSDWVSKKCQTQKIEINQEGELPEFPTGPNSEYEKVLVTLIDLTSNLGHDKATNSLCTRIDDLRKSGIINETERRILLGRLVYKKTLKELVPKREYERWKKRYQRLMLKINSLIN